MRELYETYYEEYEGYEAMSYVSDKWELKSSGRKIAAKKIPVIDLSDEPTDKVIAAKEVVPEAKSEDLDDPQRYKEFLSGFFGQHKDKIKLVIDADSKQAVPCLSLATSDPDQTLEIRLLGKNKDYVPGSNYIYNVRFPTGLLQNDKQELYGFAFYLRETKDKYRHPRAKEKYGEGDNVEYYSKLDFARAHGFLDRELKARTMYYVDSFNAQANLKAYWFGLKALTNIFLV